MRREEERERGSGLSAASWVNRNVLVCEGWVVVGGTNQPQLPFSRHILLQHGETSGAACIGGCCCCRCRRNHECGEHVCVSFPAAGSFESRRKCMFTTGKAVLVLGTLCSRGSSSAEQHRTDPPHQCEVALVQRCSGTIFARPSLPARAPSWCCLAQCQQRPPLSFISVSAWG